MMVRWEKERDGERVYNLAYCAILHMNRSCCEQFHHSGAPRKTPYSESRDCHMTYIVALLYTCILSLCTRYSLLETRLDPLCT